MQYKEEVYSFCPEAEPAETVKPMWFIEWRHWTITSNLFTFCLG